MLHVLKKISNSLSTDNSIPIFGYSINEADITSASFFCVVTLLYFVLLPYFTRLCCVLSPLLCPTSHFTDKAAPSVTLSSDRQSESFDLFYNSQFCPTFGICLSKKGLSRVQISLFCIRDEQFGNRRGQNPTICTRAISFSGFQQTQARCNLTCFHDVYWAVITVMGKPKSGIASGELRSTLS